MDLYTYLLQYRATPHGSTGESPAEMLFNRKLRTKRLKIYVNGEADAKHEVLEEHDKEMMSQKTFR